MVSRQAKKRSQTPLAFLEHLEPRVLLSSANATLAVYQPVGMLNQNGEVVYPPGTPVLLNGGVTTVSGSVSGSFRFTDLNPVFWSNEVQIFDPATDVIDFEFTSSAPSSTWSQPVTLTMKASLRGKIIQSKVAIEDPLGTYRLVTSPVDGKTYALSPGQSMYANGEMLVPSEQTYRLTMLRFSVNADTGFSASVYSGIDGATVVGPSTIGIHGLTADAVLKPITVLGYVTGVTGTTVVELGEVTTSGVPNEPPVLPQPLTVATASLQVTVLPEPTTTTLTYVLQGRTLVLKADVASAPSITRELTGDITFFADGALLKKITLHGKDTMTLVIPEGTHTLKAAYSGDSHFTASTSESPLQMPALPAAHHVAALPEKAQTQLPAEQRQRFRMLYKPVNSVWIPIAAKYTTETKTGKTNTPMPYQVVPTPVMTPNSAASTPPSQSSTVNVILNPVPSTVYPWDYGNSDSNSRETDRAGRPWGKRVFRPIRILAIAPPKIV